MAQLTVFSNWQSFLINISSVHYHLINLSFIFHINNIKPFYLWLKTNDDRYIHHPHTRASLEIFFEGFCKLAEVKDIKAEKELKIKIIFQTEDIGKIKTLTFKVTIQKFSQDFGQTVRECVCNFASKYYRIKISNMTTSMVFAV